jgi:7,8-dihydropterin-6-yl-methyl-4-(beta-D-ribofuranosyl)aminobenzene 5'-phosphate synthase
MNIMRGASQPCVSRRRERVGLDPTIALMLGEGKPLAKGIEDSTTYRVLVGRRSWRGQAASALALVRKEAVDTHCRREDDCRRRNIIGIIWMELEPVDQCEVLVLVDNVSDLLSTVPRFVTDEVSNIVRSGATEENGSCFCCAQWGLSLVITVRAGDLARTLLFDSGPEGHGVECNGERLRVRFADVGAAVFSHGHWDHVGGMETALRLITSANGGRPIPVHVNDGMFVRRAVPKPGGGLLPMGEVPSRERLAAAGGEVISDDSQRTLLDGTFCLSGEIPRRTAYEKGMPGQVREVNGRWQPDPWITDERWVAVHVRDLGAIVFTACSHAGVVNVLHHAREVFDRVPLHGVMGGFHLSGAASEPIIPQTVDDMRQFDLKAIVPGHCTGWRAVQRLVDTFGDGVVVPSAVGRRYLFATHR